MKIWFYNICFGSFWDFLSFPTRQKKNPMLNNEYVVYENLYSRRYIPSTGKHAHTIILLILRWLLSKCVSTSTRHVCACRWWHIDMRHACPKTHKDVDCWLIRPDHAKNFHIGLATLIKRCRRTVQNRLEYILSQTTIHIFGHYAALERTWSASHWCSSS